MRISPKALGILVHLYRHGAPRGSEGLQTTLKEGRRYIDTGLKELLSNGFIEALKGKTSSKKYFHILRITDKGRAHVESYLEEPLYILPSGETYISIPQNGNIADTYKADIPYSTEQYGLYTNSVNQGTALKSAVQEKEEFGGVMSLGSMPMDPDDLEAEIQKDQKRKKEEKAEARRKNYANRQRIRANRPVEKWTPTDIVNYFAEQVKQLWRVDEVKSNQRPSFVKAMTEFRATHDTTGDLEKQLLDMYIDRRRQDTKLRDPDLLFFGFIKFAPSLIEEAKRSLRKEDPVAAEAIRQKNLKMLGLE